MITSDKQYQVAKEKLEVLKKSITAPVKSSVPKAIAKAGKAQYQSMCEELAEEINQYEVLINSNPSDLTFNSVEEMMTAPIRYRLAAKMSVEAFARFVGINARQIFKYEQESYKNLNASTLEKILKKLNLEIHGKVA